jgi:hypothetical protein
MPSWGKSNLPWSNWVAQPPNAPTPPAELPPQPGGLQRAGTALGFIVAIFVCLACTLTFVVSQIWLPQASLPFGFVMEACIDVTPSYVELILVSPYISSFGPPPSATCVYSPWVPFLPQRPQVVRIPI